MRINKRFSAFICLFYILCCLFAVPVQAENAWTVSSATWQDPNNIVLMWDASAGYTYHIYRSKTFDGSYQEIGSSVCGSFRDSDVVSPNLYYYKVESVKNGDNSGEMSFPIASGTNPQNITSVRVIMYHNFINEADIASGIHFGEYAMKPSDFEEDLQYLKNNGYTTITSDDVIEYLFHGKVLPPKSVILSIDDGSLGVYTNAYPLLKKYNMKADFNVIGEEIDATWDKLHAGGTRDNDDAPYCTWEELQEMSDSGVINICSHTYGLHHYDKSKRTGLKIRENESVEDYTTLVKEDYRLENKCIKGWLNKTPRTVAYPYSRRNDTCDRVLLENTDYEILMAGDTARGTGSNYFVDGADAETQLRLMSRPCRMDGTSIAWYLENIYQLDYVNGINKAENTLTLPAEKCQKIASEYRYFDDVSENAWYGASVYYAYVNGFMKGVSYFEFAPEETITRGMAATLLYRIANQPDISKKSTFSDVAENEWYANAALWAAENGILTGYADNTYRPDAVISREQLAFSMYKLAQYLKLDVAQLASLDGFVDAGSISPGNVKAMQWAVAHKIFNGNADKSLAPANSVTRAEMATVLKNWFTN